MTKDFIREGQVVAFRQSWYDGWWNVMPEDNSERTFGVYAGEDTYGRNPSNIDNLIKVLKQIKKEASK